MNPEKIKIHNMALECDLQNGFYVLLMMASWHSIPELNAMSDDPPIPVAFVESPTKYRFFTLGNITLGLLERVIDGDG